jgi:hypothetical protein
MSVGEQRARLATRAAIVAAVLLVAVLAGRAYLLSQERSRDVRFALQAVYGLASIHDMTVGAGRTGVSLNDVAPMVTMYLESDSARRLPKLTDAVERAWLAERVAETLGRHATAGDDMPEVSAILGGEMALAAFPGVRSFVRNKKGRRYFDNAGYGCSVALSGVAGEEISRAVEEAEVLQPELARFCETNITPLLKAPAQP